MISVFFADIRDTRSYFFKGEANWSPKTTALQAVSLILGEETAMQINNDLERNNPEITVSWNSLTTDEHSDVGGIDSLNWETEDDSALTIVYENEATSEEQQDKMINWMLTNKPV